MNRAKNAAKIYADMWRMALFPREPEEKMMRVPMALHLGVIVLLFWELVIWRMW